MMKSTKVRKAEPDSDLSKKLKPIYESLDARNYKGALKHIASLTEKHGFQPILLVCK